MTTCSIVTDPVAHAELRKTIELIVADVGSWDQAQWGIRIPLTQRDASGVRACRTAFCVAGHYAVSVAGYEPAWYPAYDLPGDDFADDGASVPVEGMSVVFVTDEDGTRTSETVSDVAARAFGLDGAAANKLFSERNSLRRVLDVAYAVTGGAVDLYAAYEELVARDTDFAAAEREREATAAQLDFDVYGGRTRSLRTPA